VRVVTHLPLILLGVLLNAGAQLALKEGMRRVGHFEFVWSNALPVGWQAATSPFVALGIGLYVLSVVVWLLVLSRVQVSFAYPMLSVGYVVNAVAAYYLFSEDLSPARIGGILVIVAGVCLLARN
jgi:multidrug transporter EmrE-like cation transporter